MSRYCAGLLDYASQIEFDSCCVHNKSSVYKIALSPRKTPAIQRDVSLPTNLSKLTLKCTSHSVVVYTAGIRRDVIMHKKKIC